jgi:uncharacterized protein (DUF2267 family)
MTSVPAMFNNTIQQTAKWLKSMMGEESITNERQAYAAMRAVLHQLRDRLPVEEAVDLGAQLPLLVRGIYYEGWVPAKTPEKVHHDAFVEGVREKLTGHQEIMPERAIAATMKLLGEHVTGGEINQVIGNLPKDLQSLWQSRGGESRSGARPS